MLTTYITSAGDAREDTAACDATMALAVACGGRVLCKLSDNGYSSKFCPNISTPKPTLKPTGLTVCKTGGRAKWNAFC